ncbi:MAG: DUF5320 domain-containing protein [Candidatus Nanosyncoccaceae bacterium]
MPNFDGTGPRGEGPKTGRGQGDCSDKSTKGDSNPSPQRGMGAGRQSRPRAGRGGRGGGRGRNNA